MSTNYTTLLDTFLFRRSWGEVFSALSDEEAGELIKAIYRYADGLGRDPEKKEIISVYKMIIRQLNYSARRYAVKIGIADDES